jgi:hypothetical protein
MDSGGAVAVGARGEAPTAFVTALSAAGTEEWTATPMGSGSYHHVELLPTGTIVAVGWAGGDADNPSVVDAYSPDGDPLWRWDAPPDRRYWRVAWWPGGERILVGSGDGSGASGLLTLDSDGSLDRTFDTSMLGGVSAIAALGTGFAICGTASQGGQWAVGAFDAQGSLMWTLEGEEAGEHRCTDLESDGESRLLSWIDSQGPGPGYFDSWSVSAVSIDAGAVEWTYRVGLDGPTVGAIALGDDGTGYFAIAGLDATTVTVKPRSPGQWGTTSLGDLGSLLEEAVYRNGRLFLAGNSSFPLQGYTGCWNIVQG